LIPPSSLLLFHSISSPSTDSVSAVTQQCQQRDKVAEIDDLIAWCVKSRNANPNRKLMSQFLRAGIATGRQSGEWQKYLETDYAKQTQTQYE
jgi:hypothetical protein